MNLEAVGKVADLPEDPSPIQIGTEGVYRNKPFVVIGRILYEYEQGGWNEWHLMFSDSTSGWLSDASLEYAVSFLRPLPSKPPASSRASARLDAIHRQRQVRSHIHHASALRGRRRRTAVSNTGASRTSSSRTCGSADARFATIDYSDEPPLLFVGEALEFDDLRFQKS